MPPQDPNRKASEETENALGWASLEAELEAFETEAWNRREVRLRDWTKRLPQELAERFRKLNQFVMEAQDAISDMDSRVRAIYRNRLLQISGDIESILGLRNLDDDQRANLVAIFIQMDDDDGDDDEPVVEDAPGGDLVPV